MLYAAMEQSPIAGTTETHILERYFNKFDEQFFCYCDKELTKINTFYSGKFFSLSKILWFFYLTPLCSHTSWFSEKLAEATRRFASLNNELSEILAGSQSGQMSSNKLRYQNHILSKKPVSKRKLQELKLAFSEFYLFLILLQNYQNLNFTGFRKILKKHDKVTHYIILKKQIINQKEKKVINLKCF